jgi:uncharacterized protein
MLSHRIASSLFALSSSSGSAIIVPTCVRHGTNQNRLILSPSATSTLRHFKMTTTNDNENDDNNQDCFANPDDATIRTILTQTRTVAMIGASNRPERDSYHVMEYLMNECGYTVIPINPMYTDQEILNQKVYSTLSEVLNQFPQVDMIDIFRRSSEVPDIIQELLQFQQSDAQQRLPKYIWMQINVIDPKSAKLAQQNGYEVVMDKCPLREIPRLRIPLPIVN